MPSIPSYYNPGHLGKGMTKKQIWNRIHNLKPIWRRPPLHKCRLTQIIWEGQRRRQGKSIPKPLGFRPKRRNFDIGSM